ncbi:unnamed protein product [Arabidopsis lyrata]|uniref:Uncharacterized protein n=1 Tax=Arabidopsis thaliana x Arabidopsis arenosa TaxID=1240361 RepID=A0A8T1Y9P4_9BRAS|nr:hypothetical protein ISN45_Aa07g017890 [Arabidopsis thaliana x Arabidopsis arenosa]KAG7560259.1 hypothetical protein ISN45_Aa05g018000 [Arabidopsis thaliana x Arabidopsis arenosa]CAH8251753.1 unnamed protein product [Arabidopsis lyrata]
MDFRQAMAFEWISTCMNELVNVYVGQRLSSSFM